MEKNEQFLKELGTVITHARRAGYAGGATPSESPNKIGFKLLYYEDGPWTVLDEWAGNVASFGSETVFLNGVPVWRMNYGGGIMPPRADSISEQEKDEVITVLKAALSDRSGLADHLFRPRGPTEFSYDENLHYACKWAGWIKSFRGVEGIARSGVQVFCLGDGASLLNEVFFYHNFHGGVIRHRNF